MLIHVPIYDEFLSLDGPRERNGGTPPFHQLMSITKNFPTSHSTETCNECTLERDPYTNKLENPLHACIMGSLSLIGVLTEGEPVLGLSIIKIGRCRVMKGITNNLFSDKVRYRLSNGSYRLTLCMICFTGLHWRSK